MEESKEQKIKRYRESLSDYEEMSYADRQRMADLVYEAKGEERSLRQFADDIEVNVSTISRITNQKIARHVDLEVIAKIAAGAESDNDMIFERLMEADGMKKIAANKKDEQMHMVDAEQSIKTYQKHPYHIEKESRAQSWKAVSNSLEGAGIGFTIDFSDSAADFWDYRVKTDIVHGDWIFVEKKCASFSAVRSVERSIYKIMADHFRLDRDDYGKISIVFDDVLGFKEIVNKFETFAPPFKMSFVLVSRFRVEEEFLLRRPDGSFRESYFRL